MISILIIFALSDGKIKSQQYLISNLNYIDWVSEHYSFANNVYKKNIVMDDNNVSKALISLEEKGIINRDTVKPKKGGAKPNLCSLIKDPEALFSIFKFFKENNFTQRFQRHFLYEICQSAYCKELINGKLAYRLNDLSRITAHWPLSLSDNEFENNVLLTEKELQYITRIINVSPNALFKVLSLLYDIGYYLHFYFQINVSSNHIINEIIFGLLLDLKNNVLLKHPIDCKIEIILRDETISEDEYIKVDLDGQCDENMIISTYKSIIKEL